jgi:cardiolipin synthase
MGAARAGVQVDIVTQGVPPDRWITHFCGLYFTQELLAAGVRVHHYQQGMMHSKALVFDDRWALAGTANLDNRSMILNFEVMAVLDGPAEVRAVSEELTRLVEESTPVSLAELRGAPWPQKAAASLAHLAAPLL